MEGLCAKAMVSDETQARLRRLFAVKMRLPLTDGLHMTMLHHTGEWPEGLTRARLETLLPDRVEARLTNVEVWGRDDRAEARGISSAAYPAGELLVAVAESPQAWETHKRLSDLGFSHVFRDFRPHVTLARSRSPGAFPPGLLSTIRGTALKGGLWVEFSSWRMEPSSGSAL